MSSPFSSGPQAPERNPPINTDYYSPQRLQIVSIIALSHDIAQITTASANLFVIGQLVRFVIPQRDGMDGINDVSVPIIEIINTSTFTVPLDVRHENAFNPTGNADQYPFVVPIGDINSGAINSYGRIKNLTYINGSFINIG